MRPSMCKVPQPRRQSPGCRHTTQMTFHFLRRWQRWKAPAAHRKVLQVLEPSALLLALLSQRVASGGTSTAVRARTRCELGPSNVTTSSFCHLRVLLARCQGICAVSK